MSYNQNYYNQPDIFGAGNWSNWDDYWSNTWGDYYNQQPAWNPSQPTGTGNVPITPEPQVITNTTNVSPDTNIVDTNMIDTNVTGDAKDPETNAITDPTTNWWTNAFGESGMVNIPGFGNINLSNIRYYESVPQPIRAWLEYVVNSQRAYWPNPWQPPIIHMQPHPNY